MTQYGDICPICGKGKVDISNHLMWYHPQIDLVEWIVEGKHANSENPISFMRHVVSDEKEE